MNIFFLVSSLLIGNCNDSLKVSSNCEEIKIYNSVDSIIVEKNSFFVNKILIRQNSFCLIMNVIPQFFQYESPFELLLISIDKNCKLEEFKFSNVISDNLEILNLSIKIENQIFSIVNTSGQVVESINIENDGASIQKILKKYFK